MIVIKGQSKNNGTVSFKNLQNGTKRLFYSLSNPGSTIIIINVYIGGVLITPFNMELRPGELIKDDTYYMEVDDVFELKTNGNVHYYCTLHD